MISIISILASLLLPALARATSSAKQTGCLSNVRQIGLAYQGFLSDNSDHFPAYVTERTAPAGTPDTADARAPYSYRQQLVPYIGAGTNIFGCPIAPKWPDPAPGAWFNTDYGNNHNEANLPGASQQAWYQAHPDFGFNETVTMSSLRRPSDFIMLGDAGRSDGTASRGGMYPQPWAFDISVPSPNAGAASQGNGQHHLCRRPCQWQSYKPDLADRAGQQLAALPDYQRHQLIEERTVPNPNQTAPLRPPVARSTYRSLEALTAPLDEIARHSAGLILCPPGRFELVGQSHALPRYSFLGLQGGAEPLRVGIFAGVRGKEPAGSV